MDELNDQSSIVEEFDDERAAIKNAIEKINSTWFDEKTELLKDYFHPDMVIFGPGMQRVGVGREACIQSYEDFTINAELENFTVHDYSIEIHGETALGGYSYDIKYSMDGKTYEESGYDLFVFVRENDRWMAIWRVVG